MEHLAQLLFSRMSETIAVVAGTYGGPEVLSVIDVAVPEPRSNEVRIKVRAAGVNPFDYKSYSGAFGVDPERLPVRLGVDAIGPAGPIAVGDEVITYSAPGAYAADIVVPASSVVPKRPVLGAGRRAAGRRGHRRTHA
jgi:NADPH:quinone reductase